jgi:hypothetical protein
LGIKEERKRKYGSKRIENKKNKKKKKGAKRLKLAIGTPVHVSSGPFGNPSASSSQAGGAMRWKHYPISDMMHHLGTHNCGQRCSIGCERAIWLCEASIPLPGSLATDRWHAATSTHREDDLVLVARCTMKIKHGTSS